MAKGLELSTFGDGTWDTTLFSRGVRLTRSSDNSSTHQPLLPDAYKTGKSNCSELASRDTKRSKTSFKTSSGLASDLSILFITTIGLRPCFNAFPNTNFV